MHPFNLKAALAGAKVVTRNGEPVTQLHFLHGIKAGYQPLFGVVDGEAIQWDESGRFHYDERSSGLDLFMAEAPEQAVRVPDGWQLVPIDPSWEMLQACAGMWQKRGAIGLDALDARAAYDTALAAAPKHTTVTPEQQK